MKMTLWVLSFLLLVAALTLQGSAVLFSAPKGESFNYLRERKKHATKLLKKGPSPQKWSPQERPDGVREVVYTSGKLKLKELITHRYSIDEAPQAFADLEAGKNARGVIVF